MDIDWKTLLYWNEEMLLDRLRNTRLRGHGQVKVYENADLAIDRVPIAHLRPAQHYVLAEGVNTITKLHDAFADRGINIFHLRGFLNFCMKGSQLAIPFLPPIVEESREPDGATCLLINDGMHRVYTARHLGLQWMNVVVARNVPKEYPYYAYAMTEGWSAVEMIEKLDPSYQRKVYREPEDHKALFRDFNLQFPGVQESRK